MSRMQLHNDYLITVCEKRHVRSWSLARFRGLISTQPGTTSHASLQIHSLGQQLRESACNRPYSGSKSGGVSLVERQWPSIDVGPYGDQREGEKQVLMEMASG